MAKRKTISITEAAAELGISRQFAYEAARRGDIPTIRIGRRVLVSRVALDRLIDSAGQEPEPESVEAVGALLTRRSA